MKGEPPNPTTPKIRGKKPNFDIISSILSSSSSSSTSAKRVKRQRVPSSSDRYISQLPTSTKLKYISDCKYYSSGSSNATGAGSSSFSVNEQPQPPTLVPSASRPSSPIQHSSAAAALFNTPSKSAAGKRKSFVSPSYFPTPPVSVSCSKGFTRTLHQPTPSKKDESAIKDLTRIAMANPSLFYANPVASRNKANSYSVKQRLQEIAKTPEMVLDAPNVRDDYYTTLLSWSPTGNMLVGLDHECFLWNQTGLLTMVHQATRPDYIVSVDFSPIGNYAAIGTDAGNIKIFDLERSNDIPQTTLRHSGLSILKWKNENSLLSGFSDGRVRIFDTRRSTAVSVLSGHHEDKVCGLARSVNAEGHLFAVGGNEGIVTIWDERKLEKPVWTISSHSSAVRAMKWCPWAPYILATGGGLDDESIQFHNTDSGKLLRTLPTGSQVCDIVWSTHYKEIMSAQNNASGQLCLWRYPSLEKITCLPGHLQRPMHLALSPDGQTVASLGDDEALKFWRCFPVAKGQKTLLDLQQNRRQPGDAAGPEVDGGGRVIPGLTIR